MRRCAVFSVLWFLACGLFLDGNAAARGTRGAALGRGHAASFAHRPAANKGKRAESGRSPHASAGKSLQGKRRAASHKRDRRSRRRPPAPPPMPARIDVLAADHESGLVHVQLTGPARPPHARLFVLTDSRGRRFLPTVAECDALDGESAGHAEADAPLPRWRCTMSIPAAYRRADLTGGAMEWGDRVVQALPGQVKARWAAASGVALPSGTAPSASESSESGPPATPATEPGVAAGDPAAPAASGGGQPVPTDGGRKEGEPEEPEHERGEPEDIGPE